MTRQILVWLLTALLSLSGFGQGQPSNRTSSPKDQATAIATNSPVEVRFANGSTQRGWISEVSDTGFVLSHEKHHQMEKSPVTFVEIQTVKQIKEVKPRHTTRNILIGVGILWGVLTIIGAIVEGR
jgi:hypothetical protein